MKKQRGFTLIELLVVIAIIGILSSVVLASLNSARQKGRDARRLSDIKQIQLALELYFDANSSQYPSATSSLAPTYISAVPRSPSGNDYGYDALYSNTSYILAVDLEGTEPAGGSTTPTVDGLNCANSDIYCPVP